MNYNHIRNADLNLLVIFQALIDEKNVSRAAKKVNLTQPAMSRAFQRLKDLFDDELLVRANRGYTPTLKALQLQREVQEILVKVGSLLQTQEFDPSKIQATIRIGVTDYSASVIIHDLVKILAREAPGISLDLKVWTEESFSHLETNDLDIILWTNNAPEGLAYEDLYEEKVVCLVRQGHPLKGKKISLRDYAKQKHILVSVGKGAPAVYENILDKYGVQRQAYLRTPYFASAALLLQETDAVLAVGKRLADKLNGMNRYRVLAAPKEFETYRLIQVWHPRAETDPLLRWVRAKIKEAVLR